MCRNKAHHCTELEDQPRLWSKETPLRPPSWFSEECCLFSEAVQRAAAGDLKESRELLLRVRDNDLREWYVEHGQMSGRFRCRALGNPKATILNPSLDPKRSPDYCAADVFKRDGYQCRYCGLCVIPKEVLNAFSLVVGDDVFCATGTNQERHGAVLAFRANADHVIPWKVGGRTAPDNLVTACWSCNYGKGRYTLQQIGLNDPRDRKPCPSSDWDGLMSLLIPLRRYARS